MSIVHSEWAGNMYYYHILVDSLGLPPSEHLSIALCMYSLVIMGCLPRSRGQERHMYIRICRIVSVYNLVNYMHIYTAALLAQAAIRPYGCGKQEAAESNLSIQPRAKVDRLVRDGLGCSG